MPADPEAPGASHPGPSPSGAVPGALGPDQVRALYREPHPLVLRKDQPAVDQAAAAIVAAATLVVLATGSDDGLDASPRGGPPGFVRVLEGGTRLAFGDLAGNNRIDSYRNLAAQPEVGLLLIVPGVEETLRVNGRASVTTDDAVLDATVVDGRRPKVAVVVEVRQCFVHCAKAIRRSRIWDPTSWPGDAAPSAAAALVAHLDLDVEPEVVAADLEAGYRATLWEPGAT